MVTRRLALAAALAVLAACAPKRMPGTDIRDTPETRAIYAVIQAYADAMGKKDAAAVLALVAPSYFDDAGTPDATDDLDRAGLEKALTADFAKIDAVRFDWRVRSIDVAKDDRTATADLYFDHWFQVRTATGEVPRRESDTHRMKFVNLDGQWKIVSGL